MLNLHVKSLLVAVCTAFLLSACSSMDEINTNSAEGLYKLGSKYEKDERFEEAINTYRQVKNKHPYSRFATQAELRIADIHFQRESFAEAESAYKLFKEFHPKHEKIDYVTFQIGMSLFKQLPATIDRDLSLAEKTLQYYEEVINSYPTSDYMGSAKDHKKKVLRMLAEKENYIAHFYYIREMYDSALGRYEQLLRRYPGVGLDAKALYGASISAFRNKDKKKARDYFLELEKRFPKAKETAKAKEELINE